MDEKLRNNFWYADWSFPIFVGLLSSGVFAGRPRFARNSSSPVCVIAFFQNASVASRSPGS